MRIRSPDPEKPPGTAISPTSLNLARMTPLRGARSVVYSSATRAASRSAFAGPDAGRRRVGFGPPDVELLARHDAGALSAWMRARLLRLPASASACASCEHWLRGAFDRRAVLAGVELHERVAGLHPVAFLDESSGRFGPPRVRRSRCSGRRSRRSRRPRGPEPPSARSGGVTTTRVVSTVGARPAAIRRAHDAADGDEHERRRASSAASAAASGALARGRGAAPASFVRSSSGASAITRAGGRRRRGGARPATPERGRRRIRWRRRTRGPMSDAAERGFEEDRRHAEGHHAERDSREQRVDGQHGEERQPDAGHELRRRRAAATRSRKDRRMAPRPKPSARSVPISASRLATAAYIVLSAPNVAPIPMTLARVRTST